MKKLKTQKGWTYALKCVRADMTSYGGFAWPVRGRVTDPDWDPEPECGGGLHAWAWGEGDVSCCDWHKDPSAHWLIVRTTAAVVDLNGKCKSPWWEVVACGDRLEICAEMARMFPERKCHYSTATAGNRGAATVGDGGTATAGDNGTATAGYCGTATAGNRGTATAGYCGTATAGDGGTATAGDNGTATAGDGGTATAGSGGCICLLRYAANFGCYVRKFGQCKPDGDLEPGVPYRLNADGEFMAASDSVLITPQP